MTTLILGVSAPIAVGIAGLLLLLVVAGAIAGFNRLRRADIAAQEALAGIDVQLTRRANLIPNLVEAVKGYAAHESGVLLAVTQARALVTRAAESGSVGEKSAAEASMNAALGNLLAVAERYPDLKASGNFLALQQELAATEGQLAFARQFYNDAVATLNTLVSTLPWLLLRGVAGVARREFYKAPAEHASVPSAQWR